MAQFRPEWRLSLLRNGGSTHTGLAAHSEPENSAEQQTEIVKTAKAIHDYFDAAREIEPAYQQQAFWACATAIVRIDE